MCGPLRSVQIMLGEARQTGNPWAPVSGGNNLWTWNARRTDSDGANFASIDFRSAVVRLAL